MLESFLLVYVGLEIFKSPCCKSKDTTFCSSFPFSMGNNSAVTTYGAASFLEESSIDVRVQGYKQVFLVV